LAEWILTQGIVSRLVCVGTVDAALMVEGCVDMRGSNLRVQMDLGASAAFAIGPSSGWMHLASLCKCPHLTWVGGKEHVYVKRRYLDRWNPLRTPVSVLPGRTWQPEFAVVRDALSKFLKEAA
jgi:ADP-heptose:LPS heptosyltransferase